MRILLVLLVFLPILSYGQKIPEEIEPGPTNPPPSPPMPTMENKPIFNNLHYFNNSDFICYFINSDNNIHLHRRELFEL